MSKLLGGPAAGILTMAFQVDATNAPNWHAEINIVMREKLLVDALINQLNAGPLRSRKEDAPIQTIRLRPNSRITVAPVVARAEELPGIVETRVFTVEEMSEHVLEAAFVSEAGYVTLPWKDNDGSVVVFRKNDGHRTPLELLPALAAVEGGMLEEGQGQDLRSTLIEHNIRLESETLYDSLCALMDSKKLVVEQPDDDNPGPFKFWSRVRFEDFYGSA